MTKDIKELRLHQDEFGRWNGVAIINKPAGITSHDVVNILRRKLGTKKIGHAGTLDPFAEGLLVLLVGKATKLSDTFLGKDKTYIATILHGVSTDSADPEGKIQKIKIVKDVTKSDYQNFLKTFIGDYKQQVPIFSSVKVKGQKLRVLARKYNSFKIINRNAEKVAQFFDVEGNLKKEVEIPIKILQIYKISLKHFDYIKVNDLNNSVFKSVKGSKVQDEISQNKVNNQALFAKEKNYVKDFGKRLGKYSGQKDLSFLITKVEVSCSKGTYIRQLAEDIGSKLSQEGIPSMLIALKRTKVGDLELESSLNLDEV